MNSKVELPRFMMDQTAQGCCAVEVQIQGDAGLPRTKVCKKDCPKGSNTGQLKQTKF